VQGADGVGDSRGRREDELELEDVELSESNGEEQAVVGSAQAERDQFADV